MTYIVIIQALFFYGYCFYVYKNHGVLRSISDSWYHVKHKWAFDLFAAGVGLPMWFYGIEGAAGLLFVVSGLCMFTVTLASMFKQNKVVNRLHYVGTVGAIVFAVLGIYAMQGTWEPIAFILIGFSLIAFPNHIWWIEVWIFTIIIAYLL